ncbi:MAG: hypothetical protein IJU31_05555 [Synergistaceae bacterium]|nr:hypothetical protein [Synergistaceae bacterium]
MKKFLLLLVLSLVCISPSDSATLSNCSEAFISLPFGHTFARTQKRMLNSGARVLTPRKDSLTMEGFFESYPALYVFGFYKSNLLNSKSVYLQSMGNADYDRQFHEALQKGFNDTYGSTQQTPSLNTRRTGKIVLRNIWTPDRYTTITMTYNPEASKRFPGSSLSDKFIQITYKYSKWD